MLIETPATKYDTVTIKLAGNEELVARFVEQDDNGITIEKPMMVVVGPEGLGLGPFTFTVNPETKITLNKNVVMFMVKTDPEMAKQYVQSTTGIAI